MIKLALPLLIVTLSAGQGLAALPFTCRASGDSWSIVGAPNRKVTCSLRCLLRDPKGDQDSVGCTTTLLPGPKDDPVCEGFITGKHWTSATLVSGECATME